MSKRVILILGCFVLIAALLFLGLYGKGGFVKEVLFPKEDARRADAPSDPGGAPEKTKKAIRSDDMKKTLEDAALKAQISHSLINSPFSSRGVNKYAIAHYHLTEGQVGQLKSIAAETRAEIVGLISKNLKETEDPKNSEREFIYQPSAESTDEIEARLRQSITDVAGEEFATKALQTLVADGRFINGGKRMLKFEVNPFPFIEPNSEYFRKKGMTIVRFTSFLEDGTPSIVETNYENFKESLSIDLGL